MFCSSFASHHVVIGTALIDLQKAFCARLLQVSCLQLCRSLLRTSACSPQERLQPATWLQSYQSAAGFEAFCFAGSELLEQSRRRRLLPLWDTSTALMAQQARQLCKPTSSVQMPLEVAGGWRALSGCWKGDKAAEGHHRASMLLWLFHCAYVTVLEWACLLLCKVNAQVI